MVCVLIVEDESLGMDNLDRDFMRQPDADSIRKKSFPYYNDWLILFGKDRAIGEMVEGPTEAIKTIAREEATKERSNDSPLEDMETSNASNSSASSKGEKKRNRAANAITMSLSAMAEAFSSFFEKTDNRLAETVQSIGYAQDLFQARRSINVELLKLPLTTAQRLRVGFLIVRDAQRVDFFSSLSKEDRLKWVFLLLGGEILICYNFLLDYQKRTY
ncbi:hypothetical protein U1Q18_013948 [Sarracenia purpurea var. burkii]